MTLENICKLLQKHCLSFSLVCQPWPKSEDVIQWYLKDEEEVYRLIEGHRLNHVYIRVELTEDTYMKVLEEWADYDTAEEIIASYHHAMEWFILVK